MNNNDINLLKRLPSFKKGGISGLMIVNAIMGFGIILFLLFLLSVLNLYYNKYKLSYAINHKKIYASELSNVITQHPLIIKDQALENEIKNLQTMIKVKDRELTNLSLSHSKEGFLKYLVALSQTVPQGLWITKIDIDLIQKTFVIEGKSLNAKLIPLFIEELNKNKALDKINFKIKDMKHDDKENILKFSIENYATT